MRLNTVYFYLPLLVCLLILCAPYSSLAQEYIVDVQQFGIEEGLSGQEVMAVFRDKDGFLWISTKNDLQRYDGYSMKSYPIKEIKKENIDFVIRNIGQYKKEWLWLLVNPRDKNYEYNLFFINTSTGEILSKEEYLSSAICAELDSIFADNIFIHYQTEHPNLICFESKHQIAVFDLKKGIKTIKPPSLEHKIQMIDSDGYIWIKSKYRAKINSSEIYDLHDIFDNYLYKIDLAGKILDTISMDLDANFKILPKSSNFYALFPVTHEWNENIYFYSDLGRNLYRYDASGKHQIIFETPQDYSFGGILEGMIWCHGKSGWKIFNMNGDLVRELARKDYRDIIFKVDFNSLFENSKKGEYFLKNHFGLSVINIRFSPFVNYFSSKRDSLPLLYNRARGIYAENDSLIVNFEYSGVVLFQKNKPKNYKIITKPKAINPEKEFYHGFSIIRDAEKNIWIGDHYHLNQLSPDLDLEYKRAFFGNAYSNNFIWSLWEDEDNCIWLSNNKSLVKYCHKDKSVKKYMYEVSGFGVKDMDVYQILPDKKRKDLLWLSSSEGLYLFDRNKGEVRTRFHYRGQNKRFLPAKNIYHMHVDKEGNRWIGTDAGLIFWNPRTDKKRLFTRKDGLSNNTIYAVYEDEYNNLWMSSDYGIQSFNKESFLVQSYLPKDGVATKEFNRISHFQEADGTIYFGGLNGVTSFHPKDFIKNKDDLPAVIISDYEIFDGAVDKLVNKFNEITKTKTITFNPGDRFFKLKFVLPASGNQDKTLYAWKIEGVFDDWTYQKENSLQLASLPYGNFTLRIKAQNTSGWSPKELKLQINVLKPFYLKNWFIITCFLFLGISLFLFTKRRTKILLLRQKELETEVKKATFQIEKDKELIEVQAHELRKLDKTKSRFFANISHEFRTPLTLILGPIKSALKKSKQLNLTEMGLIERNGDELLRLINQILDLSKLEDGKMNIFYVQGDIIRLLQQTIERFKPYAQVNEKQLLFQSSISALEMDYDKTKLQGILSNLIFNALKFTQKGDKIEVTAKEVDQQLYISVKDTGQGMPREDIPLLFNRFHQVEKGQATTSTKGTGIGLSLTKQLIELLEGSIKVKSQLGEGSEFTFNLPIRKLSGQKDEDYQLDNISVVSSLTQYSYKKPVVVTSDTEPVNDESKVNVLIVEDTADLAQYIASSLPENYQVSFAENGLIGIQKAMEEVPDIIISDVMMPEKDGFELCEVLKNDTITSHIPIILLTALAEGAARIKGLKRGADAYMSKPFEEEELQVRVAKLLELRKTLWNRFSQLAINTEAVPTVEEKQNPDLLIEDAFITKVRNIVNNYYMDVEFDLHKLISKVSMSERHFRRKLKALTGVSPNQFIRSFRIEKSKELLLQTELNIAEIAYQIGFDSPKYFSRIFSKTHGISPRDFRKK